MKGMTLGLLDGISQVFTKLFQGLIELILEPLMNFIVAPIFNLIFQLINYILGLYFYTISIFILGLIDFVEMLFRALAGLGVAEGQSGIMLSLDGESGDILIQLIRHPSIQQAFLAMCIVGLFLLVVTSVFQIIKVEYTTEGAKNSKTPIMQKAFKGLANLMLLPILCVFGIVFANQLLGLLDKATRASGDNPTISGTLFVTAASDALYKKEDAQFLLLSANPELAIPQILLNSLPILFQSIKDVVDENYGVDFSQEYRENVEEVEDGFINQKEGYKYYLIIDVCNHYNYGKINYLLLIFGGCTVLKCLYFTCFGMVIRLYKCAVLFIISPAVIGMTPVNEGGLGKWRGQFIGQVLSAYGTILSINLFFIIVRVLLSVNVSFVNVGNNMWAGNFMTGLLKSIFVIAGCLLIEKFSKEIGGYFGAEDAMGAGKDMSKQVADVAMKGVKVVGAVAGAAATGGASLIGSMSTGWKSGGLGGALKGGLAGALKTTTLGKIGYGIHDRISDKKAVKEGGAASERLKQSKGSLSKAQSDMAELDAQEAKVQAELKAAEATKGKHGVGQKPTKQLKNQLRNIQQKRALKQEQIESLQSSIAADSKAVETGEAAQERRAERKQKRKDSLARTHLLAAGFAAQSQQDVMSWIPGYSQFVKPIDESAHKGVKLLGDDAEQAMAYSDKQKQKKVEDEYDPLLAESKKVLIGSAGGKVVLHLADKLEVAQHNMQVQANNAFLDLKDRYNQARERGDSSDILSVLNDGLAQFRQMGAEGIDINGLEDKLKDENKLSIDLKEDLNIEINSKAIKQAVWEAIKTTGSMDAEAIIAEVKKLLEAEGLAGNKNTIMLIESQMKEILNEVK